MEIAVTKAPARSREELIWLAPFAAMVMGLYVVAEIASRPQGLSTLDLIDDYVGKALHALPLVFVFALIYQLVKALLIGSASPFQHLRQVVQREIGDPLILCGKILPLALMPVMMAAMGMLKMLIPVFSSFAHDDLFARMDKALFFGRHPWELTHAVFGSAEATLVIDRLYTFWVFLLSIMIVLFALAAPRLERARFFLSFTAAWIVLGVIGAYLGSSAGPCFQAQLGLQDASAYTGLMDRLHAMDAQLVADGKIGLGGVQWQSVLWDAYARRDIAFGMGISAMPSMHNAIAMLYFLAALRFGRITACVAGLFAIVTFIGSVHLGWHYAVDAIIGNVAVIPIWMLVSHYLDKRGYAAAVNREAAR
jgi:PAP2 superfamily